MAIDRAIAPAGRERDRLAMSPRDSFAAPNRRRNSVRGENRLRMAAAPPRLSIVEDGVLVLHEVEHQRNPRSLHNALREKVRIAEGRNAEPTAGIVDAQSIRGADTVGKDSRGYDAGKKINGRKRSIVVDTIGMLLIAVVTAANVQDRDGGNLVIAQTHKIMPSVRYIWADGGYAGLLVRWARMATAIALEIVRKQEGQKTFEVLPRRWVVERTFAWLMRWRRLRCDYERSTAASEAMMKWAMVGLMTRRLARSSGRQPWSGRRAA